MCIGTRGDNDGHTHKTVTPHGQVLNPHTHSCLSFSKNNKRTSDVDVSSTGTHGKAGQQTALYELVGVLAHDLSVLAGAWIKRFVVDVGRKNVR